MDRSRASTHRFPLAVRAPHLEVAIEKIVADLSRPEAYPFAPGEVTVIQTHISVVFLAGDFAYKVKKPVDLGFLDFSTLERRRYFCGQEVTLNRRLAAHVYLGVVPIREVDGRLAFEAGGEPVEYAVKMERLSENRTLEAMLARGDLHPQILRSLGERLADFHRSAEAGKAISRYGSWEVVAGNCRENFEQSAPFVGRSVRQEVLARLARLTERELQARRALIEARAARGVPRDTHGDLHLDHVYHYEDAAPPKDFVIVDCIEFNERFRYADPIADLAFLIMDLRFHGRSDLASILSEAYFDASGDDEGRALVPLYVSYRAVVRGKVESFELDESEIPTCERRSALNRARAHFLLALCELAPSAERPCLVLVCGLPWSGKSTVVRALEQRSHFGTIHSDLVRKNLAGVSPTDSASAPFGQGIYTPEWNDRTYAACLEQAHERLLEGERIAIDATFHEQSRREEFFNLARTLCVPFATFVCEADAETTLARIRAGRTGPSDADEEIYRAMARRWEPPGEPTAAKTRRVRTDGPEEATFERALEILRGMGLG